MRSVPMNDLMELYEHDGKLYARLTPKGAREAGDESMALALEACARGDHAPYLVAGNGRVILPCLCTPHAPQPQSQPMPELGVAIWFQASYAASQPYTDQDGWPTYGDCDHASCEQLRRQVWLDMAVAAAGIVQGGDDGFIAHVMNFANKVRTMRIKPRVHPKETH